MTNTDAAEHAAYCGRARGFKICYCRCPLCRAPADEHGNRKDICNAHQDHRAGSY